MLVRLSSLYYHLCQLLQRRDTLLLKPPPEEIDVYVAKLESKIKGLQRTVTYLKKHKTQMLKDTEF